MAMTPMKILGTTIEPLLPPSPLLLLLVPSSSPPDLGPVGTGRELNVGKVSSSRVGTGSIEGAVKEGVSKVRVADFESSSSSLEPPLLPPLPPLLEPYLQVPSLEQTCPDKQYPVLQQTIPLGMHPLPHSSW